MTFEPELGQAAFSNTPWTDIPTPDFMSYEVECLGEMLRLLNLVDENPCYNTGATFENDIFAIRAYCWCDGDIVGHEDGCPPNFEYKTWSKFAMYWYKHTRRGSTVTNIPEVEAWYHAMEACRKSILK